MSFISFSFSFPLLVFNFLPLCFLPCRFFPFVALLNLFLPFYSFPWFYFSSFLVLLLFCLFLSFVFFTLIPFLPCFLCPSFFIFHFDCAFALSCCPCLLFPFIFSPSLKFRVFPTFSLLWSVCPSFPGHLSIHQQDTSDRSSSQEEH